MHFKGGDKVDISIELVKRAKSGDDDAFSTIYGMIYKDMYKFAYYYLDNAMDAEDAVSEAVLDAYKSVKKLRQEESFKNWIFKILTVKCKKKMEKYIHRDAELTEDIAFEDKDYDESQDVKVAFSVLTEEEKQVVSLAVFAGYKSHEIAESMGLNSNTVRSKLSRALAKMQKKLEIMTWIGG